MDTRPGRSTRFLTVVATALLTLSVAFGLVMLVGLIFGFGPNGHEVAVRTQVSGAQVSGLPAGSVRPDDVDVVVRVAGASREQLAWAALRDLVPGVVFIAVLWLLLGLLRSVRDRDPFTERNVRRLRELALLVLIGLPVAIFLSSIFASQLADSTGLDTGGTQITLPGPAFLAGLGFLVLAEVFSAGVRMRDDLEGTV